MTKRQKEKLNFARKESLDDFIFILENLISSLRFGCNKFAQKHLNKLNNKIKEVKKVLPAIYSEQMDMNKNTITIVINEKHFSTCLKRLEQIKKEIVIFLEKNSFILKSEKQKLRKKIRGGNK